MEYEIRIMFAFMKAKESEKRYSNSYKCTTSVYNKAMRRAKKEKGYLSNLIESVVICYSKGMEIKAIKQGKESTHAIDVFSISNSELITAINQLNK